MRCEATGKVIHQTKIGACIAAKHYKSNLLNVYKCGKCQGWHIGNSNSSFRFQKRLDQIFARDKVRQSATPSKHLPDRTVG